MERIVEVTQEQILWEFEMQKVNETALMDSHSDKGEMELDPDERTPMDDHYPSGSGAGGMDGGGYNNEDNVVMEEMLYQDGWVLEGGQYPEDDTGQQVALSSGSAQRNWE